MISAWELYLWTRLDSVLALIRTLTCLISIGLYCYVAFGGVCAKWAINHTKRFYIGLVSMCLCLIMLCGAWVLLPTKKDAAMIWIVPQLATVENADLLKGEAAEIYTLAKEALKESIGAKETE